MPFVSVKAIEGTLSPEQKSEMIARVTDAVVAVEGEFVRTYTWVIVEEIKGGVTTSQRSDQFGTSGARGGTS